MAKPVLSLVRERRSTDGSCRHAMFRNPVIAKHYPVPARSAGEKGLEISVELMFSLAQISWATIYNGNLVLKGFATLLTPTLEIGTSVLWHLKADKSGKRQSYNDGWELSHLHTLDDALFFGARDFVGWVNAAEHLVGKVIFGCYNHR